MPETSAIISHEKWEDFEEDESRAAWRRHIEKQIRKGHFSKEKVLQKFTKMVFQCDNKGLKDDIKKTFQSLRVKEDKETVTDAKLTAASFNFMKWLQARPAATVSRSKFISRFSTHFSDFYPYTQEGLPILYYCAMRYGAFPFDMSSLTFEPFSRALAFIVANRYYPGYRDTESFFFGGAVMSCGLGTYRGTCPLSRTRTTQDRRRLDFRSLAMPSAVTTIEAKKSYIAAIDITYFTYSTLEKSLVEDAKEYEASPPRI